MMGSDTLECVAVDCSLSVVRTGLKNLKTSLKALKHGQKPRERKSLKACGFCFLAVELADHAHTDGFQHQSQSMFGFDLTHSSMAAARLCCALVFALCLLQGTEAASRIRVVASYCPTAFSGKGAQPRSPTLYAARDRLSPGQAHCLTWIPTLGTSAC